MYERILIPTDGSKTAELAVESALDIAEKFEAEVYTLYVVDTDAMDVSLGTEQIDRIRAGRFGEMDDLEDRAGEATQYVVEQGRNRNLSVEEHFRAGQPHRVIADFAEDYDIDLIVMGSHGRSGVRRMLLGSVTERVLRSTHRSVLVVDERAEPEDGE
ncbi:Nucleotide-binding universal stress protein, UspA family [Haladaptatus litoreus]|uniref:Nucleotide-binding universal stress protein, UspA family n=1 Tax=Haladaptatus litoreus TaxID=553468 RepID=A0A1N7E8L4_9EURY|nr:universal stress protein [Haladaptatus litoreus]SIR84417.1 Nucleotide-binding universal stress protein, UspA family [Haladaptatus litoreus]